MSIVLGFRELIANAIVDKGLEVCEWSQATGRRDHLLEINTKVKPTIIYFKESKSYPHWWGLTENRLILLDKAEAHWFIVLLSNGNDSGYVLSSNEVKELIQDKLPARGDYKIHEKTELQQNLPFRGINELISRIL